jgi:lysophospholipase L1-like esterase
VTFRNAGQVGYSSQQGLQLLEELLESETPDLITASWVVNDVDRLRFFLPNGRDDAHTEPPSPAQVARTNRTLHTWPLNALLHIGGRVSAKLAPLRSQRPAYELAHVRTTPADYEANLQRLIRRGQERGVPVLLIVLPFHLPAPVPPEPAGLEALLQRGREALEAGAPQQARIALERAATLDPYGSEPAYLLGRLHEAQGQSALARKAYARAYEALIHHCVRDAHDYNAIMRRVAQQTGTPLVDAVPALGRDRAKMSRYVPGDYIHPNAAGHRALGLCLAPAIGRTLGGDGIGLVQECE